RAGPVGVVRPVLALRDSEQLARHCPDEVLLGGGGDVEEEHAIESLGPGELGRQLADVVTSAHKEHVGLMIGQVGKQRAEEARADTSVSLAADATEGLLQLVHEKDTRARSVGNPQGLAQIPLTLSHETAEQGADVEEKSGAARFIAKGLGEAALSRARD